MLIHTHGFLFYGLRLSSYFFLIPEISTELKKLLIIIKWDQHSPDVIFTFFSLLWDLLLDHLSSRLMQEPLQAFLDLQLSPSYSFSIYTLSE